MTDKIIAHGIDVSDCFYRCENMECLVHTDLDGMPTCNCDSNSVKNCYYKRLKRKEQECEKLKEELTELKERLNLLEKQANVKKVNSRFIPNNGEEYYFVDEMEDILTSENEQEFYGDEYRLSIGNCFRTEEEAEKHKRILINTQKLKDLAFRLNDGEEIDWNDDSPKYYLNLRRGTLDSIWFEGIQMQGAIYCLDANFLEKAVEEIGEENLIELIKG